MIMFIDRLCSRHVHLGALLWSSSSLHEILDSKFRVELLASFRKSTAELAVSFCFKEPE